VVGSTGAKKRRLPLPVAGILLALTVAVVVDMPWYLGTFSSGHGGLDAHASLHNAVAIPLYVVVVALIATDPRLRNHKSRWVVGALLLPVPVWFAYFWIYELRSARSA
jgi:hypothetical protein